MKDTSAIVCGAQLHAQLVVRALDTFDAVTRIDRVYVGTLYGVDQRAVRWAIDRERMATIAPVKWTEQGTLFRPLEHERTLCALAGMVLAFPGGPGTSLMVQAAKRYGVPVWRYDTSKVWNQDTSPPELFVGLRRTPEATR